MTIDEKVKDIKDLPITYKKKDINKIIQKFERYEGLVKIGLKIKSRLLVKDCLNILEEYLSDLPELYQDKYNTLKEIYKRKQEDYWKL